MTSLCPLLAENLRPIDRFAFGRLHPQGRRLVSSWAARAAHLPEDADTSAYFEAFIYLWFAFNGWGSCVTGTDVDREWVEAVAADQELARLFDDSLRSNHGAVSAVKRFAELWPIFKSSEIRRHGLFVPDTCTRQQRVQAYFDNQIPFEPSCWHHHQEQSPPPDWKHCLKTLYRVRCNLFHGEKSLDSENDRLIVTAAYPVLARIVRIVAVLP